MKNLLTLLSAACLLLASCKKDSDVVTPLPPPGNNQPLLKTIVYQNLPSPYYYFEHDAAKQIAKASFASGAFTYSLRYEGNRLQEMKSIESTTKISTTYHYDDQGRLAVVKISTEDGSTQLKRGFLTYDNQNRLSKLEWEVAATGGFVQQRELSFTYGADGNLAERRDHRPFIAGKQPEALYIDKFEQYDDKVNVDGFALLHESSEHLVLFPGIQLQRNNPAKLTRTGDGTNYEITYNYAYNGHKQPEQRTGAMLMTNGPQAGQTFTLAAAYTYDN